MKIVVLDENDNPIVMPTFKDAALKLGIDYNSISNRLRYVKKFEDALKYRVCRLPQYESWVGRKLEIVKVTKKNKIVWEFGIPMSYCNEGCDQLSEYCICEKYDKAVQLISKSAK